MVATRKFIKTLPAIYTDQSLRYTRSKTCNLFAYIGIEDCSVGESLINCREISGLTLLEVSDLTEVLRKKFDIKEMPVMGVMMPGMGFGMKVAAKGGGAAKGEEKVAFDLKLEGGFDASVKIKIIKEVRACTDLGLKEAKDLVEKAPTLLKGVSKEEAEKIIAKLKEVGANVVMECGNVIAMLCELDFSCCV